MNNASGSYEYTLAGVRYEIINFSKDDADMPNEWRLVEWETDETVAVFDTLREVREFLAGM